MSAMNRGPQTPAQTPAQHQQHRQSCTHFPNYLHLHHQFFLQQQQQQQSRRRPGSHKIATGGALQSHGTAKVISRRRGIFSASTSFDSSCKKATKPTPLQASEAPVGCLTSSILVAVAGALAFHVCGPGNPIFEFSPVSIIDAPLQEFGPADLIAERFGPTRPVWSLLLQYFHYSATAVSAIVPVVSLHGETAAAAVATAAAAQRFFHNQLGMALAFGFGGGSHDHGGHMVSLVSEARGAVDVATVAVRGAVADMSKDYDRWFKECPLICMFATGSFCTIIWSSFLYIEQISRSNAAGHGSQNSDVSSRAAVDTDAAAGFTSAFTNPNIIFEQSSSMLALSPVSSVVSGIASDLAGAVVAAAVASAASSNQPAFQYVARLVAAAVRAALESQASVTGQPSTLQGR